MQNDILPQAASEKEQSETLWCMEPAASFAAKKPGLLRGRMRCTVL